MVRKLASAIVIAGALNAAQVNALGLGELTLHSALNEPLEAEIKLLSIGDLAENQIIVKLASIEDFEGAGVERSFFLTNLKFDVEVNPDGTGVIKINTQKLVREPYLDFVIETRWPSGRLLREYTALLDLPVFKQDKETTVNLGHDEAYAAPASMPEAAATQAPAPQAMPMRAAQPSYDGGGTYRIQNNDTLWDVASRVKPGDDVSVQQTMVAIQQMNPHAFMRGNINLMRAGSVIRIPDSDQISQISAREAIQEVAVQNREWRDGIAGAPMDARSGTGGGAMATAAEGGRLSLTSASTSGGAGADGVGSADTEALRNQLAVTQDQLEAAERDREEAQSEVAQMREQIETLQRMVQLKDQQLAKAQAQFGADDTEEAAGESEMAMESETMESETMEPESMESETMESEAMESEPMVSESAAEAEEGMEAETTEETAAVAEAAKPVAKPAPKPAPKAARKPEPGFVEQFLGNPLYWGGALLLLIVAVVALVLKLRSGGEQEEEYSYTPDETAESEFDEFEESAAEEVAAEQAESEELEEEEPAEEELAEEEIEEAPAAAQSETGDAIGEADIYVAYGRYQHAVELLKNAIGGEPERMDLRLKLLEVYLEAGDKEGFKDQFAVLQTMGDQDALAKAKELLSTVDGASDWLADAGLAAGGSDELEADLSDAELGEEQTFEFEGESFAATEESVSSEIEDVELELDDIDALSEEEDVSLEFDSIDDGNDLDLSESLNADIGLDDSDTESDESFALDTIAEEESADIELDLGEEFSEELVEEEPDFSIEEAVSDNVAVEETIDETFEEAFDETLEEPVEDLLAPTDEFDATAEEAAPAAAETVTSSGAGAEDDLEFLTDADEVATKLDLARAYIEMGDVDGARDILEEVMNEGEEAQKAEANRLMERIA